MRIRGCSFGFEYVFRGSGKVVSAVKGPFKGKGEEAEGEGDLNVKESETIWI